MEDLEMKTFEAELLGAIRVMKTGKPARVTQVRQTAAAEARTKVGMSQSQFAAFLGVSMRTLQDWEQGLREPSGAAKTLLRIAARMPEAIRLSA